MKIFLYDIQISFLVQIKTILRYSRNKRVSDSNFNDSKSLQKCRQIKGRFRGAEKKVNWFCIGSKAEMKPLSKNNNGLRPVSMAANSGLISIQNYEFKIS